MAMGRRRASESTLMLCPWLARTSQSAGSVEVSLAGSLGFRAKRCLSLSFTAEEMSAKVGLRDLTGPQRSFGEC